MKTFIHTIGDVKYTIKVGTNANENWTLIDNSYPDDLWFHLDNFASAHVVISQDTNAQEEIFYPNQIIGLAANYCKSNSKYGKNLYKVKIVYTEIKNLKKGKEVGSVYISKPNYINV
jgi:predicted ribosome quality control (RQC) complex YloA/Tae2 family protein